MKQYTAIFYKENSVFGETWMERKEIRTGKADIYEAFEVAVKHGHNPQKQIKLYTTPAFNQLGEHYLTNENFHGQNGSHTPGKWCWGKCIWCGAVPTSPDFDTDKEAIEYGLKNGYIELV